MYKAKIILATMVLIGSAACSDAADKTIGDRHMTADLKSSHSSHQTAHGYAKPSAAIDFRHEFSGRSSVGSMESIEMKVMDDYPGGTVEFEVVASDGLTLLQNGAAAQKMFLDGRSENDLNVQFQTLREGRHSVNIMARVTTVDGQKITRSYTIPVYAGDGFAPVKGEGLKNSVEPQVQKDGSLIIEMEGEEEIIIHD